MSMTCVTCWPYIHRREVPKNTPKSTAQAPFGLLLAGPWLDIGPQQGEVKLDGIEGLGPHAFVV